MQFATGRCGVKVLGQGPELDSPQVQVFDHLEPVGQPPREPVNVGDHQGVSLYHQVQQFQEPAPVVFGPAGLLGSDVAQGAAGADQPLNLQVQFLVLRFSRRDPGITVQRYSAKPPGWNT